MKRTLIIAACALAAVFAAVDAPAQDIRWHDSYAGAMEEAKRTNKPLLVSFRCVP